MDVYTIDLVTGESVQVTFDPGFDDSGRWSPDGSEISFHSDRSGILDVWKVSVTANGTPTGEPVQLTTNVGNAHCPRWSFDGEWITYEADDGERKANDIWVMRSDGNDKRRVTDDSHYDRYPGWSPDGEWIIYDSERDSNMDLYLVPVGGGTERRITMDAAIDRHADWSPQGNLLAFHSGRGGSLDIWLVEIPDPAGATGGEGAEPSLAAVLALGAVAAAAVVLLRRRGRPRQE
jgi:Tol biopolymer transport system component